MLSAWDARVASLHQSLSSVSLVKLQKYFRFYSIDLFVIKPVAQPEANFWEDQKYEIFQMTFFGGFDIF